MMKRIINSFVPALVLFLTACGNSTNDGTTKYLADYPESARTAILLNPDSMQQYPFLEARLKAISEAQSRPNPVLLCTDSLNEDQQLAQLIALSDANFTAQLRDPAGKSYRSEVFGVYPARASDLTPAMHADQSKSYRVELYNYTLNEASSALVDLSQQKVLGIQQIKSAQPDIPASLKELAIRIAISSSAVQEALGYAPGQEDALMANTKTALNRTRCERSGHLCVAPTFVKEDKALWAIVDLTDYRVVGIRWTNVGTTGPAAPITERGLQDDKISSCFCELETELIQDGWKMNYMLTSSDGLRISDVIFNGQAVLRSAKLVDWHVSYSGTDGFGYSDAVGCPYFSQAAVVAWDIPRVSELQENGRSVGFVVEQTFRSEGWPTPCNYNYVQRYEFYKDGRFRVSCASLGRGCGNDGTYRPVFRIAFAGNNRNFYNWSGNGWEAWKTEKWMEQTEQTRYSPEHALYKLDGAGSSYLLEPGDGQFGDGGKGDFSFLYVTRHEQNRDEGETDLVTIGPCCNTDYRQGPEKFIEPNPESIANSSLVLWYVAQLKNNDARGQEYCWAESELKEGRYVTRTYPCFCGPMFIPQRTK